MGKIEHTITIDGREVAVPRDTLLIEACKKVNAHVPTLCYNENVRAYGVCRICLVEVTEVSHGREKTRLVPSCVYQVRQDGLKVVTNNERITNDRKWIIQWLLARCENEKVIQDLAAEYGVTVNPRLRRKQDDCILCGLCVRACSDVVGVSAISFEGRGEQREVTTPWRVQNDACIACGTCAYVCPTNCITLTEQGGLRTISRWHGDKTMIVRQTEMMVCESCGNYYMPKSVSELFQKKMGIEPENFLCPDCR